MKRISYNANSYRSVYYKIYYPFTIESVKEINFHMP